MQKTANQIKSEFELLASGHYQIHSFLYAQEFEQQAYENLIYPLMLVYPLGGSLSGTTYTRNYRVIIADRVLKSEGNELEVESDTQLIALDTLAYWMKLGQNERFTITSSNTITPFWEKWGDEVTGHFVDIGIEEFYDFNSCAIPLSSAIPSPTNPCKDARILINSVIYGNAPSNSNFNVVVKDQLGSLVGSLIGGEWVVNTGGSCADATYTIEDSLGNVLYTGTIPSGGSVTEVIGNSTLNVNNSVGTLISSKSILAEGTDSYNVADSVAVIKNSAGTTLKSENILATASENITINDSVAVIKDSANNTLKSENILAEATENISISDSVAVIKNSVGTTLKSENILAEATENITINDSSVENSDATYSVDVLAEGSLVLPDSQINVNSVDRGDVVSVKTIDVNLENSVGDPVTPTSVGLVGNTLTIEVPSGATPMNVDFSSDKLTAAPFEDITFTDLSDQTPTHWSWQFSDSTTSIVQNPVKSFLSSGFYNVTLLAGKIGAGGVNIKNSYIEIINNYFADLFGIPAAAYSLRKLTSNSIYSGAAIRVRRSSDNTEQDINFVSSAANSEIDTSALLTFVGSGNGFITIWYDQSGNARNSTQTTASSQPQIVSSGSLLTQNGKSTINFNNHRLSILSGLNLTNNIGKWFVFSVAKNNDNTSTQRFIYLFSTGVSTTSSRMLFGKDASNLIINGGRRLDADSFSGATSSSNITLNQSLYTAVLDYANSNAITYLNNSQIALNTSFHIDGNTSATNSQTGQIGSDGGNTSNWLGNIQELIIYNTDKNTELNNINLNINTYYNVF
jgi:PKD repeat protein